jgi:hypothetical protein
MSKDYDSTLARMAGNIAAGIAPMYNGQVYPSIHSDVAREAVSRTALDIADRILTRAREQFAHEQRRRAEFGEPK